MRVARVWVLLSCASLLAAPATAQAPEEEGAVVEADEPPVADEPDTAPESEPEADDQDDAAEVPEPAAPEEPTPSAAPPAEPEPAPPSWTDFVRVRGFAVLWLNPIQDPTVPPLSDRPGAAFHFRFARLAVQARPSPEVGVKVLLGFDHTNVFFDYQLAYTGNEWLHITAGQFRLPLGANIVTPAFRLRSYDRPRYVYVMSKQALRDLGLMVHSPPGGIFDGALEYALGMFNGEGRAHDGMSVGLRDFVDYLFVGRAVFNPGVWILPEGGRLALGASFAHSGDPQAGPDPVTARQNAVYHLAGRLTPYELDRDTWIAGGDLTFSAFGIWAQGEVMYMRSAARDGSVRVEGLAGSFEAGYLIEYLRTMAVARFEYLDASLDTAGRESMTFSVGARVRPAPHLMLGAYYLFVRYEDDADAMTPLADDHRLRVELGVDFM